MTASINVGLIPGIRNITIPGTVDGNAQIMTLPSVLPVVRPDGTFEEYSARLTGFERYSFWITDDKLGALVDAGKMEIKVKWNERRDYIGGKAYRAAHIYFR